MYFLMTNDVEAHSLSLNREDPGTVDLVYKIGLLRLLDLLSKHDVSSTFYFTGMFAEVSPESVELVREHGYRDLDVMVMIIRRSGRLICWVMRSSNHDRNGERCDRGY